MEEYGIQDAIDDLNAIAALVNDKHYSSDFIRQLRERRFIPLRDYIYDNFSESDSKLLIDWMKEHEPDKLSYYLYRAKRKLAEERKDGSS